MSFYLKLVTGKNRLFKSLAIFFLICSCSSCTPSYNIVLMGGQSNMVGRGKVSDLQDSALPDGFILYDFSLKYDLTKPEGNFGPEIGLAQVLHQKLPDRKFILVKYAIGGASLLDWAPDYSREKAKMTGHTEFGNMYKKLFSKLDSVNKLYKRTRIVALLWMQGERDARILEAGLVYRENFEKLIRAARRDTDVPKLPVIFGTINPLEKGWPAREKVRKAQSDISMSDNGAFLIDTDALLKWDDSLHYSSKGQIDLGKAFGEKLVNILKIEN